jgi:hypothetical protein
VCLGGDRQRESDEHHDDQDRWTSATHGSPVWSELLRHRGLVELGGDFKKASGG